MSRLMQQVAEIRERAHVCPDCRGHKVMRRLCADGIWNVDYVAEVECRKCKGTGQVEAPDTDTLCHAIEVLAAAVEAFTEAKINPIVVMCMSEEEWRKLADKVNAAVPLVENGLTSVETEHE